MRRIWGAAVASVLIAELVEVELEELLLETLLLEVLSVLVAFKVDSVVLLLAVALLATVVDNETELSVVAFAGKVVFPKGSAVVLLPLGLSVLVAFSVSVSRKFIKTSMNFKMEPRSSVLKV